MSKLFKVLGIGTAIGTLAYAVIKYKHDEKFKEKVDTVVDKAADFASDHPILTTVAFTTAVMVPVMAFRAAMEPTIEHYQDIIESVTDDCDGIDPDDPANDAYEYDKRARGNDDLRDQIEMLLVDPNKYTVVPKEEPKVEKAKDPWTSNWDEKYREKWDKVNEFAKTLDLDEGESFWIDEPSQYDVEGNEPIVSHMINGSGCYPPERD